MFLDLDGEGPVYAQLTRALKAAILAGRVAAGERLPSTRALAEELGVARITVLSAYDQLNAEGYIQCRRGSGCRVNALQTAPPLPVPQHAVVAPTSRYTRRVRARFANFRFPDPNRGLRFELQFGEPVVNPAINGAWSRELAHAAKYTPLRRGHPQGLLKLREQVCVYLARRRDVRTRPEDVLIVSGSQQAFELTARVLLDEGDRVAMEEPHYWAMWEAFAAHGARCIAVPTDASGMVCAALPRRAPKLVCVTPSHQFPAGAVLPLPRRLELLRYAETRHCWILEDDYDSEFRYDSQPLAALRSLDGGRRVIYVGTFSKVMFGSLRLGYMVLPASLRRDFILARYLCDMCSPMVTQQALANFMADGGFARQLRRVGRALKARREVMLEGLHRYAGDRVRISDAHAGMHLVVWLPGYSRAEVDALIIDARTRGLGLFSVAPHYHDRAPASGLLLGYCGRSEAELRGAMRLFGACLDAVDAQRHGRVRRVHPPAVGRGRTT